MKKIVILGGGIGGVTAATFLSKKLGERAEIILMDKEDMHHFQPSYPWLMMGWRNPDQLLRPLSNLKARNVRFSHDEVVAIEPEERRVKTKTGTSSYDYLLVALGAQLDPQSIEGLAGAAHHPYDLESAVRLGKVIRDFRGGRIAIGASRLPFKCPAAPYEAAFLMDYLFRKKGMRGKVDMEFFTPEPWPAPAAGEAIGRAIEDMMRIRGIDIHTKREMQHVDAESKVVHFKGGSQMDYELLVAVPPHTTCDAVRTSALAKDGPWIPVDKDTMRTSFDDVYAVGDVTKIPTPKGHVPALPKAGVFAEGQAKVAAQNIVSEIVGGETESWDGYGICFLETGYGKGGMVRGNFYGDGAPEVRMWKPRRLWHWGKVLFERRWFGKLFQ